MHEVDADALYWIPGIQQEVASCWQHVTPEGVEAILHSHMRQVPFIQNIGLSRDALSAVEPSISGEKLATLVDVATIQHKDPWIREVINRLKKCRPVRSVKWCSAHPETRKLCKEDDILYRTRTVEGKKERQIVLTKSLRPEVFKSLHDEMGHLGRGRTLDLVRSRFFWPGMVTETERYVSICKRCPRCKASMVPESVSTTEPMELLCIDYLSLEPAKGFGSVLVITDHFSKLLKPYLLGTSQQKPQRKYCLTTLKSENG